MNPSPYLPDGRQWAWNTGASGLAKECARKYFYKQRKGYQPRDHSVNLIFGKIYAKALESFHKYRANGVEYDDARNKVVHEAFIASHGQLDPEYVEQLSGAARYKSRPNLIRSIIWYLEEYRSDPCKTIILADGSPAVELAATFEVAEDISLVVHLDRLVEHQGDTYIQDQKTTGTSLSPYYFKRYSPDNQMSQYTVASQIVWKTLVKGVMIDAAQIAVGFTRFWRGFTFRTPDQNEEWLRDTTGAIERIWDFSIKDPEAEDPSKWPMNDTACQRYGGCEFLDICSKSSQVRQEYLNTHFEIVPQNPLAERV